MKRTFLSILMITGFISAGISQVNSDNVVQEAAKTRLDSTLQSFVKNGEVAGASALIYEKGKEVYFNAFGYADLANKVPMKRKSESGKGSNRTIWTFPLQSGNRATDIKVFRGPVARIPAHRTGSLNRTIGHPCCNWADGNQSGTRFESDSELQSGDGWQSVDFHVNRAAKANRAIGLSDPIRLIELHRAYLC